MKDSYLKHFSVKSLSSLPQPAHKRNVSPYKWLINCIISGCWKHGLTSQWGLIAGSMPMSLKLCVCSLPVLETKHVSIFPSKGKKASVDFTKELLPIWLEWLQPAVLPLWYMKMSHIFYLTLEKRRSKQKEVKSRTSAQGRQQHAPWYLKCKAHRQIGL